MMPPAGPEMPDVPEASGIRGAGRFAPTPTGRLHLGNARTALLAWLSARSQGLRNVLRIEDLDPVAFRAEMLESQYADLDWLGLTYDEEPRRGGPYGPYRQMERHATYDEALRVLGRQGLLYPCYCSRKEVLAASRAPHAGDEGPVYPGTCRPSRPVLLDDLDAPPRLSSGPARDRRPSLRLDVAGALKALRESAGAGDAGDATELHDALSGPIQVDFVRDVGDFVVRRVDGIASYQIACAWDDAAMHCAEVVRGSDLLRSALRQWLLLRLWKLPIPRYAHVGLVVDARGRRLAKRDGDIALQTLREAGVESGEVIRLLARLSGLPDSGELDLLTEALHRAPLNANDVRLPDRLPFCVREEPGQSRAAMPDDQPKREE